MTKKLGAKEAERLAADDLFSTARLPFNSEKNRYVNILPCNLSLL